MSLARQLFQDMRPLFRLLEEPFGRSTASYGSHYRGRSLFDDSFFQPSNLMRPSIEVTDEGSNYIVEAELPGVKKGDIDVRIGDGGRSVTVEGKTFRRHSGGSGAEATVQKAPATDTITEPPASAESSAVTKSNETAGEISTSTASESSTSFSGTVWLPRVVDETGVSAKLADGVLRLTIPKAEDKGGAKIIIE